MTDKVEGVFAGHEVGLGGAFSLPLMSALPSRDGKGASGAAGGGVAQAGLCVFASEMDGLMQGGQVRGQAGRRKGARH